MKLYFVHHPPPGAEVFETVYEEELAMDQQFKAAILKKAEAVWMYADTYLAGECYGLTPKALYLSTEEKVPDLDHTDNTTLYCYSMTILPALQGRGLGRILFAHWLGLVKGRGAGLVCTHATSDGMIALARGFAFKRGKTHRNWFSSGRRAVYYSRVI